MKIDDLNPKIVQKEPKLQEYEPLEKDKNEGLTSESANGRYNITITKERPPLVEEEERPPPPHHQRLKKQNQGLQFKKFIDILDQLYINVPFLEAIDQMPTYAKFLKDIVSKKRKVEKYESVYTSKECFSMPSKLPPKRKDLNSFIIPYSIGDNYMGRTLCDLRLNMNLMAKSVFIKLGMGNARPTTIIL
ncbi:uncharacterized protein LOC120179790 [Hibiscus syriacus]|uniref:uncharacterized protein LOC120179790 n=1 Tax=Hibiscus syriacus TaxID=106335 RepID=UPI001923974C|nr:uncharacterized protein LOC120179790 [Hibiscus syriacus]